MGMVTSQMTCLHAVLVAVEGKALDLERVVACIGRNLVLGHQTLHLVLELV